MTTDIDDRELVTLKCMRRFGHGCTDQSQPDGNGFGDWVDENRKHESHDLLTNIRSRSLM